MKLNRPVVLSVEDFDELTEQGRWTTLGGPGGEEIDAHGFEGIILSQLRRYTGDTYHTLISLISYHTLISLISYHTLISLISR